jgi:pimeloyl-ACP methyl ester carboxylesterase
MRWIGALLILGLLAGCANVPTPAQRLDHADQLARARGWQPERISAGSFELVAWYPAGQEAVRDLTVYVEGDGFAWFDMETPSTDPTPRDPLALRLALSQPQGRAVYLARPCQYGDARNDGCDQRYWTNARFAPEVVQAEDIGLNQLKQRMGAERITLVGYSGGGAIATLLAQRRTDVVRLVTVAGNLDHRAWALHHRVSSLSGSLNAADNSERIANLPQIHFVGDRDVNISPELARKWPLALRGSQSVNLRIIENFNHACCWAEHWGELWNSLPPLN